MGRCARSARRLRRAAGRTAWALVPRQPKPCLVASQRLDRARQRRRPVRPESGAHTRALPPSRRSDPARARRVGCRAAGSARMKHLLVTNDFPPKIGGIQSLLWEWWRRLPPEQFAVLTSPHHGAAEWDLQQPFRVERVKEPVLLPHPAMVRRTDELAREIGAGLVVIDPALPLGLIGPSLELPYAVVLHGAEVTVPGRLPGSRQVLGHVLRRAQHVIA